MAFIFLPILPKYQYTKNMINLSQIMPALKLHIFFVKTMKRI